LGRTGSDFSVGSDCLNVVKAGPGRKMLENTLKEAPLACPAQVTGQLVFTRGSFSGKQKNYSPFTPNNAWTGYLQHKLPDKLQFNRCNKPAGLVIFSRKYHQPRGRLITSV